ncbi:glycoside hydrolase family 16 protein [Abortiporus biennis]|nr:glycoside hydrolase family 16 protein [Abortiporus biennis]
MDNTEWQLIFSDEFNNDGRTFRPGDDPFWEAVDLRYRVTNNLEWYDPAAITTANGSLIITLSKQQTHDALYRGGMMTTWNKFCFTGGMVETSVVLAGSDNVSGLRSAVWTMGNLGRAGYGASLEGMWPYTYDACDVGTVANQTRNGQPIAATDDGDPMNGGALSYLQGQRLSRCTCPGESHPGPMHSDGTYVGRSAPEIDIFESTITGDPLSGQILQSSQWPFNNAYTWFNDSFTIQNTTTTTSNPYKGDVWQQTTSCITDCDPEGYELIGNKFMVYGLQYKPGFDDAYISWSANGKLSWTLKQAGLRADPTVEISARPVPQEPMYLIADLSMPLSDGIFVDLDHLTFPAHFKIDYIRVYQDPNAINYGCDPQDFPTADYIEQYLEAYTNPSLTTWQGDYKQPFPKNSYLGQC